MKLDNKTMLRLMKEEFDKRVKYYLEEIEVKDTKRNVNLVKDAQGLKVKNSQGLELTIEEFQVIDNVEYIVLRPPEIARNGLEGNTSSVEKGLPDEGIVYESEDDNSTADPGIRNKSKKMDYKRTLTSFDASYDSLKDSDIRDGLVYVKITDFEKEYSL